MNISSNPVVPFIKSASSQPKEIAGKSRNCTDTLIQKKENRRSQPVSSPASVFINEEDLLVENALVEEPNNRREAKSMLKKLNLNIKWASATKDFRRVYEGLENGTIFPEDRKLRHQAFYLVEYLVKTGCTKRKKGKSEEVINIRVGWEEGKNESEEEKGKVLQKKRRIAQEKESGERKLVNLSNEEGVGVDHPLMEKSKERGGGVQDGVPFSFSFEDSDMRVKGKEEEEGDAMEIKMNEESTRTIQARRESKGGKLVI